MENYEKDKIREHCQSKIDEFMKGDETYSVHGPYVSKEDGRKRVVVVSRRNGTFTKRTVSWPKLMAEILLDGDVWGNDTIDHISRDHTNNNVFNLRALPLSKHVSDDVPRVKVDDIACAQCQTTFTPSIAQRNNQRQGVQPAGPFCGRRCTGLYGAAVQNGTDKLSRNKVNKEYYFIEKSNSQIGEIHTQRP